MIAARGRFGECPVSMPIGRVDLADPPGELCQLLEEQPICRVRLVNGETGWLTTSYDLGRSVLTDRRFSASRIWSRQPFGEMERWLAEGVADEGSIPFLDQADPPAHARRRTAIMSRLEFQAVRGAGERIQELINVALDALEQAGPPADFMEHFARPIPGLVLCDVLGVPEGDRATVVALSSQVNAPATSLDDSARTQAALHDLVENLTRNKSRALTDDLLSDLIRDRSTTHDEVVKEAVGLLRAGHGATTAQFGYGLLTLMREASVWEALKADPTSIERVVEEMLRYDTVFDANPTKRTAIEDVQMGGVMILAGETVVVSLLGADRDPDRFTNPNAFLPERDAREHLAFGAGIHRCAGQHLARLELSLGLTSLVRRLPNLRLAVGMDEIRWLPDHYPLSGPVAMPVAW